MITKKQKGLVTVWNCDCKTPAIEIDENIVYCNEEFGGCGCIHNMGCQE